MGRASRKRQRQASLTPAPVAAVVAGDRKTCTLTTSFDDVPVPELIPLPAPVAESVPMDSDSLVITVARLRARQRKLADELDRSVLAARDAGASWGTLAAALGVTRQSVMGKYGRKAS